MRGRGPVGIGTNSDVNAAGKSDGMATVGDRRPKHRHTINDPGHTHNVPHMSFNGSAGPYPIAAPGDTLSYNATASTAVTGITAGVQTNTPVDTAAYLVVPFIIKT